MSTRLASALVCCAVAATLTSCTGTQDEPAASAAHDFLTRVEEQDGARACALLAPAASTELEDASGKPCAQAILEEDLGAATSPVEVQVYDLMAQVRFESDTVFLSRFDGGWRVVGAACVPQPGDRPYDCAIEVS